MQTPDVVEELIRNIPNTMFEEIISKVDYERLNNAGYVRAKITEVQVLVRKTALKLVN